MFNAEIKPDENYQNINLGTFYGLKLKAEIDIPQGHDVANISLHLLDKNNVVFNYAGLKQNKTK